MKKKTVGIVLGVSLAWIVLLVGILIGLTQIDFMASWYLCDPDSSASSQPWIYFNKSIIARFYDKTWKIGESYQFFWMLTLISAIAGNLIMLATWFLIGKRGIRWCFNASSGKLDPPKWKVIVGFAVIVLSDVYVGIETLQEDMTTFILLKTLGLIIIHALILGFMFLEQKTETEEKKEE